MKKQRVLAWFSCGAASAAATKVAIAKYKDKDKYDFEIVYCKVAEEHPDNERFLKDCEKWFGMPIKILINEKYDGSIFKCFEDQKIIKMVTYAPCTNMLKKDLRKAYERHDDIHIFGMTLEEEDRFDRLLDANNGMNADPILIDRSLTKADCLAMLAAENIEIPVMYKLGYNNNNCIGCVKGGIGYWNKIRVDFPVEFNRMAELERKIGHAVLKETKVIDGEKKVFPLFLDELEPKRGRHKDEVMEDCGIFCQMALNESRG